jgi:hypothetical protein
MRKRATYRSIPPGTPIPADEPKRYLNGFGYVRLRWKVAPYAYVECYEHRVIDGAVVEEGLERHHINRVRDDNRPDNLATLTPEEHDGEHGCEVLDEIIRLYAQGHSTVAVGRMVGRHSSVVYRHLVAQGVPVRSHMRKASA